MNNTENSTQVKKRIFNFKFKPVQPITGFNKLIDKKNINPEAKSCDYCKSSENKTYQIFNCQHSFCNDCVYYNSFSFLAKVYKMEVQLKILFPCILCEELSVQTYDNFYFFGFLSA